MLKKFKVLIVLISLSITLCLMSNTYSRYVASSQGQIEVMFAKWQILVNNTDITNNKASSISFEPVIEKNENVADNKLAPSSIGYFDIQIDPTNVEVSFKYQIDINLENENIPDLVITKYAILPKNYIEGDTLEYKDLENNSLTNTLTYNEGGFEQFTVRVYFQWYDGENELMDDSKDTEVSNSGNNSFKINANINFEQAI